MGKKYLITGGLGFIGKAITLSLLSKNNTVIIADNNFRKKKNDLKHKNLYVHKIDVRKKNQLKKISKDIDSVIHLAFINGTNFFYEKPELVLEVGIKGIINLIEICEENFIKEFFLASSSEVYQNAPYIPTNEMDTLMKEVRDYEPDLALTDHEDGLTFYRHLADTAQKWVRPGGWLILEVGLGEHPQKAITCFDTKGFAQLELIADFNTDDRILKVQVV